MYTGVITVRELIAHAITDEWNPDLGWQIEGQGYQRAPIEDHWKGIASFLQREEDPLLPTNALLASRDTDFGRLKFASLDGNMGYLEIPDWRPLYVIDYQHRWRAFRYVIEELRQTDLYDVTIPVTILSDTPIVEEMKQFFLINNKQKRVDTDLALTLMESMSSGLTEEEMANLVGPRKFRIRGTRLVVNIAQMSTGPWVNKLQEPNMSSAPGQITTLFSSRL